MRSQLVTAALAAAISLGTAAFAATTTNGTITALDLARHQITLDNNVVYMLPTTFKDPGLKVGEKVAVVWDMKAGAHEVESISIHK